MAARKEELELRRREAEMKQEESTARLVQIELERKRAALVLVATETQLGAMPSSPSSPSDASSSPTSGLPPGWRFIDDTGNGIPGYYWNASTKQSSWARPQADESSSPPVSPPHASAVASLDELASPV
jgi:hypothetical protein